MKLEGFVSTIIYKNENNGYSVFLLKTKSGYMTVVGESDGLEVGDEIELEGEIKNHIAYGEQFVFTTYKKVFPKSSSALAEYIAANVKGVGKKTARNIIDKFGDETINVIRFKKGELVGIKGLNERKIEDLNTFFDEEYEKWNVINFLSEFGISVFVASKIYQSLGNDTIDIVKENPYRLLMFVKTLDFKQVDKIGIKRGVPLNSQDRIDAGIIYSLNYATDFGHTCLKVDTLVDYASGLLSVGSDNITSGILRLEMKEKLYRQTIDKEKYIFRRSY